nr:deoxyribose-phosphate aldolase [uncultured Cardiobacterium sp.]
MKLSRYIDHTLLAPQATATQITQLCDEAREHDFFAVCVNPARVRHAKAVLAGTAVKVCTVIGFPLGADTSAVKAFAARDAVENGADELDMVMNIGLAKDGDWAAVQADIAAVVQAAAGQALVKVILETCLLTADDICHACAAAMQAGADFVKTSTGFSSGGATIEAVRLMRACVGSDFGVKAAGGIRTPEDFQAMLAAGANRIGSSAGCKLLAEQANVSSPNPSIQE